MSFLNDAINAALRDHNVPQVGTSGSSSVADALRSLLAPKARQAGLSAEDTHVEPDALQELLARLEHGGYGDVVRSWIGTGRNEPISRLTSTPRSDPTWPNSPTLAAYLAKRSYKNSPGCSLPSSIG